MNSSSSHPRSLGYDELLARLDDVLERRPDKPEETTPATARALWWAAAGQPRSAEWAMDGGLPTLTDAQAAALEELVQQRIAGMPLCYLTGRQRFMGLEMLAAPGALIPRKETEVLGRAALELIRDAAGRQGSATVVDVCTGSGNLALAFAAHEPRARVHAADLSPEAVAVARRNAAVLGMADAVEFRSGDLALPFADLTGQVDVLTCNPPYISTARLGALPPETAAHEPALAFDGGPFGVKILTRLVKEGAALVKAGGWLCLEVGAGQGPAVAQRFTTSGTYGDIRTFPDEQGTIRALAARVRTHSS
jgi:release factor glutamine methyltransferase